MTEKAKRTIDNILTPFLNDGVERINKHLAKDGMEVGVEFNWFLNFTEDKKGE